MERKDNRPLDARAREVAQKVNNSLNSKKGILEGEREARLAKVAVVLCEFKSVKQATKWLLKKDPMFGGLPPLDLVGSEYATKYLLAVIKRIRDGGIN